METVLKDAKITYWTCVSVLFARRRNRYLNRTGMSVHARGLTGITMPPHIERPIWLLKG